MPIVITAPQPGFQIGPGCLVGANTDFDFSTSLGYEWSIAIETEGGVAVRQRFIFHQEQQFTSTYLTEPRQTGIDRNVSVQLPKEGDPVSVRFQIATTTTVAQEAITQAVWSPTVGLGMQQYLIAQAATTTTGGFTQDDRIALQTVEARTTLLGEQGTLVVQGASGPIPTTLSELFSRPLLDSLTLDELTAGETCEPLRVRIGDWYYGIIVRVTTIDPELVPKTPDSEWYFPDLAVLRIFRGGDLEYRRGIHTPSFMVEKPWQWGWQILNVARFFGVAADYTIAVDWRPGCCGRVFLQRFP